ncbi:MAG TPA: DCC1-like thiol-disulfide oxidoreductase family protein [Ignavibacteriales bacterium]|nr:DCC1-like thiol-disulfide oxidoreductase family protein [Ignavibacteriales bacterium]
MTNSQSYFNEHPVILFDGVCGLCNKFVDLIIKLDRREIFRYAPLQSNAGIELQKKYCKESLHTDTIILIDGSCHIKAFAVRRILRQVKLLYPIFLISNLLPAFAVNLIYDAIARSRYKVFGKYPVCRVPTEKERKLFLD